MNKKILNIYHQNLDKLTRSYKSFLGKHTSQEITLFRNSKYPISFKPFYIYQGLSVLLLLFLSVTLFFPKQTIDQSLAIKTAVTKQTSTVVAGGNPVQWSVLVKKSDITKDNYVAVLPKSATNINITTITKQEAEDILQSKPKDQLTIDQKISIANQNKPKSFFVASIFDSIGRFLTSSVKNSIDDVEKKVNSKIETTEDSTLVDLSDEAIEKEDKQKDEKEKKEEKQEKKDEKEETPTPEPEITPEPETAVEAPSDDGVAPEPEITPEPEPIPEITPDPEVTETPEVATEAPSPSQSTGSDDGAAPVEEYVKVEYETPAPEITEQETETGKLVTVSSGQGSSITSTPAVIIVISPEAAVEAPSPSQSTGSDDGAEPEVTPEVTPIEDQPSLPEQANENAVEAVEEPTPEPELIPEETPVETPEPATEAPAAASEEASLAPEGREPTPVETIIENITASLSTSFSAIFNLNFFSYLTSALSEAVKSAPVLTTINISPLETTLTAQGPGQQLTATTLDQDGNSIKSTLSWTSDNSNVASVDSDGFVTPLSAGTTNINASSEVAPLTDVLASTTIPGIFKVGQEDKIKIKWKNNGNQDVTFNAYDIDGDGYLDYVEWTVPHLSEQIFNIIFISKAFHLDTDQTILADIYDTVASQNQNYASIPNNNYIRVTFEHILDNTKDITVYGKPTNDGQSASIQVYPVYTDADGNITQGQMLDLVDDGSNPNFSNIDHNGKYRILLQNLQTPTDVFDLKISGNIDVDYIVDPVWNDSDVLNFTFTANGGLYCPALETSATGVYYSSGMPAPFAGQFGFYVTGTVTGAKYLLKPTEGHWYMYTSGYSGLYSSQGGEDYDSSIGSAWDVWNSCTAGYGLVTSLPNATPNVPTLVSPASGSYTNDNTPTLSANYSDADTGDVGTTNYRISSGTAQNCLDNANIVASGTSSATADENENTTWTNGSSIGSGATYYWCAQNNDGVATSAWTSMGNFILDVTAPTAAVTYSISNPVKSGDSLVITATFSEALLDSPVVKVEISGSNTLAATVMTKSSTTVYTYTHTVGAGDGTATVAMSVGTDAASNVVTSAPTSGSTFTVDNTNPTVTVTSPTNGSSSGASVSFSSSQSDTNAGFLVPNLDSSLISWWKLDDNAASTTVTDNMAAHNGTSSANTSTLTTTGKFGKALTFNGSSDRVSVTGISLANSSYTISGWIYQTAQTQYDFFLTYGATTCGATLYSDIRVAVDNTGHLYFGVCNDNGSGSTAATIPINTWTHVAVTFNTVDKHMISYINGAEARNVVGDSNMTYDGDFMIGAAVWNPGPNSYHGNIDDVFIYNKALTADEVTALYNGTAISHSSTLSAGSHTYLAYSSDLAGNVGTSSTSTFTVDTTSPTAAVTYSTDNAVKSGASLTITATFNEAMADSPAPKIAITGSNTLAATAMTKTDSTHYYYTHTVGAGDGTATVALSIGTDAAGNVITSAPTSGSTFTVDNTAPTNQDTVFAASANAIGGATVTIVSSADATNNVWFAPSGTTSFSAGSTMTTAGGTATSILAPATAGAYKMFVIDVAGNYSTQSTAILTVDSTAPTITSITSVAGDTAVTYYDTTDNSSTAVVYVADADTATCKWDTSDTTYDLMSNTCASTTSCILNLSGAGAKTVYMRCMDTTGNKASSSYTLNYTIDAIAPTTTDNFTNNDTWTAANQTITLTPADATSGLASTKYCQDTLNTCTVSSGTSYTTAVTVSTEGTSYFRYASTDNAGNVQTTVSKTVKIDTTDPVTTASGNGYTFDTWTASAVSVSLTCADTSGSGCLATLYCTDSTNTCTPTTAYSTAVSVSTTGTSYFRYYSTDTVSNSETANTKTIKILSVPAGFALASNSIDQVTATWTAQGDSTYYYIENTTNSTNSDWITATTFSQPALNCAMAYSYRVKARSADLTETSWSSTLSQTPTCGVPGGGQPGSVPNTPPALPLAVSINQDADSTSVRDVILTLTAGSNVDRMFISNNPDFVGYTQFQYVPTKQWTLDGSQGQKTVYVKFFTVNGVSSDVFQDSINYMVAVTESEGITGQLANIGEQVVNLFENPEWVAPEMPEDLSGRLPIAFQGLGIMSINPLGEFALNPIESDLASLSRKFAQLQNTLTALDIRVNEPTDVEKLANAEMYLPNLTQAIMYRESQETNELATTGIPLEDLSSQELARIPTDIVFARMFDGLIDINSALAVDGEGNTEQTIKAVSGKPMELVIKPNAPADKVIGLIVSNNPQRPVGVAQPKKNFFSIFFTSASAAVNSELSTQDADVLISKFEYIEKKPGVFMAAINVPLDEGEYKINTVAIYKDQSITPTESQLTMLVDPEGYVFRQMSEGRLRIKNATVTIYSLNTDTLEYNVWPSNDFLQQNPVVTNDTGRYSFLVPKGMYYLTATAPGYKDYKGAIFSVTTSNGVVINIELKPISNIPWWFTSVVLSLALIAVVVICVLIYIKGRHRIQKVNE